MNKMQKQVQEFHVDFNVAVNTIPTKVPERIQDLRINLIKEEFDEFVEATQEQDLVKIADALGDILYVVFGAAIAYGIDMEPIVDEIHRSNMSKRFPDGTVHYREGDHKILKPDTYSPADIWKELIKQGMIVS
jgi:predicted HAD superfamily Cof-like phosphohydrolase